MKIAFLGAQLSMAAALLLATAAPAQQLTPLQADPTITAPVDPHTTVMPTRATPSNAPIFHDLDLLRRGGFVEAKQAMVSLRILTRDTHLPASLQAGEYTLIVNGTPRASRLHAPGSSSTKVIPLVLLVFPPNDPTVHSIGIREATKYFSRQPDEILPWKVGILDANGKLSAFTNGRSQLLVELNVIDHTVEPMQYTTGAVLSAGHRWEGSWQTRAEDAIALMQSFEGPKVILAMNPIAGSIYGLNDQVLAHNGPESLSDVAQHIGAHIYIANVGGPEVLIPGGAAAQDRPAQVNTGGLAGPTMGSRPSSNQQISPVQTAALNYFAYRSSVMAQTALDTLGGFSNSLSMLAGQIHRDLDENYSLDFDLTLADRDKGIPAVELRLNNQDLRVAILDVVPIGSTRETYREVVSKEMMEKIRRATKRSVSSPDFLIYQHVDYFPLGGGLAPVLPMSGLVEWTGKGNGPQQLLVAESIEDLALSSILLEHDVQANWNGRGISWERDGHLRPGHYLWRIALHDAQGNVLASAEQKVTVELPQGTPVASSSLIVGRSCREQDAATGALRVRSTKPVEDNQAHFQIDPMRAADCRLKPEAVSSFAAGEILRAFVRIYPTEKLERNKPESWVAHFTLHTPTGIVETEQDIPFTVDSSSGYLASVSWPLSLPKVTAGPHTLDVQMRGPGIRHELNASRPISILP